MTHKHTHKHKHHKHKSGRDRPSKYEPINHDNSDRFAYCQQLMREMKLIDAYLDIEHRSAKAKKKGGLDEQLVKLLTDKYARLRSLYDAEWMIIRNLHAPKGE